VSDRIQEVAERANVPEDFARQLAAANALPGEEGELELAGAVRRPVAAVLDGGGAFG
jgi:hypothetical protein